MSERFRYPLKRASVAGSSHGFALISLTINLDEKNRNSEENRNTLMPAYTKWLNKKVTHQWTSGLVHLSPYIYCLYLTKQICPCSSPLCFLAPRVRTSWGELIDVLCLTLWTVPAVCNQSENLLSKFADTEWSYETHPICHAPKHFPLPNTFCMWLYLQLYLMMQSIKGATYYYY